jgi:DNA ligase (NAD+)
MAEALNNPSKTKLAKEFNTVVFTGAMTVSRAEAKAAAEGAGFKVAGTVSRNTDYVVTGDNPGSNEQKAHDLGVKVLTEAQWARLLKKSAPK